MINWNGLEILLQQTPCWGPAESVHVGFGAGLDWAGDFTATNPWLGSGESVHVRFGAGLWKAGLAVEITASNPCWGLVSLYMWDLVLGWIGLET